MKKVYINFVEERNKNEVFNGAFSSSKKAEKAFRKIHPDMIPITSSVDRPEDKLYWNNSSKSVLLKTKEVELDK